MGFRFKLFVIVSERERDALRWTIDNQRQIRESLKYVVWR